MKFTFKGKIFLEIYALFPIKCKIDHKCANKTKYTK